MVLPIIPILGGVGAGMIGQGLLSAFAGEKKPAVLTPTAKSLQTSDVYHSPFERYQPSTVFAPQQTITMPSYQIQIESPKAKQELKATTNATQEISQTPNYNQPTTYPTLTSTPTASASNTAGIDNSTIILVALIAAGGVVAYGVLS